MTLATDWSTATWSPTSWQTKPALQQPSYPDARRVEEAVRELSLLPPLVTSWEIERLKGQLAEAARGERFLLQGGDCAESFEECTSPAITSKLKILLQMSLVLVHGARRRVTRVGRFAGQYAKPRSEDLETRDGVTLPSYRGDLINRLAFTEADRTPDPRLMLRGYERAALTINFIRALIDGGFADLHHPEYWDLDWVQHSPHAAEYHRRVAAIRDSLHFLESLAGPQSGEINRVDYFTSHEALQLLYEQAQTRQVPRRAGWYNLSTHFPWLGMRTAQVGGAHVEYFRGIANPIAVKVGPAMTPDGLLELADVLDPHREPGRLTFIHRFGHARIAGKLPPLLDAVRRAGRTVLWVCDPMHGNTETLSNGYKTRRFENVLAELEAAFDLHEQAGGQLGGVHFELTGEDVTECIGGARGIREDDLRRAYRSQVDPRLNYEQALEMALRIAGRMGRGAGR
ncbi:MAG TPA: 3-deoxy-7-phosphoheptulonate synthase class II [Thermoanaerobaculia bacterium]|jgi:3-deoxy-7-phosphoheptulonate synthase|nr:3-deoxy-7-phosphoheptulonate synthase class II [Thermoanaerobaculia bacterium]